MKLDENENNSHNNSDDNINNDEDIYKDYDKDDYFESKIEDNVEIIHKSGTLLHRYNHIVDARQPGSGKTTNMLEKINSTKLRDLVIAPSIEFLEGEIGTKINKQYIVLQGFERLCPKWKDPVAGKTIQRMKESDIAPKYICTYMNCQNRCSYREQFEKIKPKENEDPVSIGTTKSFLHILDFLEYDFNSVWIEENALVGDFSVEWIPKKIKIQLYKLNSCVESKKLLQIIKSVENREYEIFSEYTYFLKETIDNYNMKLTESYTDKKIDKYYFKSFCYLNINELEMYIEFEKKHEHESIKYQQFLFYKQLHEKNIQINYNCAAFMKNEFLWNLKTFEKLFPRYGGEVKITTSNLQNKNTKIIKVNSKGYYREWVEDQLDREKKKLKTLIKNLKYRKTKKILILTYKFLVEKYNGKILGCPCIWFGGSHGMNTYRNYDILIVFGTHLVGEDGYREYFEEHHPDEEIPNFGETITEDGVKIPKDERLQMYYRERFELDVYDTIHRLRPLSRDVVIYYFGNNIPERLKDEFSYFERDL